MNAQQQQNQIKEAVMKALHNGFFIANGKKYSICIPEILSGDRFRQYRISEIEISTSMSLLDLFQRINEAVVVLQNMTIFGDAHKALHLLLNHQKSIINFQNNPQYEEIEKFCSVFCLVEGESKTIYDPSLLSEKINDWREEGLSYGFFHFLAANTISGFRELLSLILTNWEAETTPNTLTV